MSNPFELQQNRISRRVVGINGLIFFFSERNRILRRLCLYNLSRKEWRRQDFGLGGQNLSRKARKLGFAMRESFFEFCPPQKKFTFAPPKINFGVGKIQKKIRPSRET